MGLADSAVDSPVPRNQARKFIPGRKCRSRTRLFCEYRGPLIVFPN